jgi:hypothetical protein
MGPFSEEDGYRVLIQAWDMALRIREAALGPDHPFTRQSRKDIEELEPA